MLYLIHCSSTRWHALALHKQELLDTLRASEVAEHRERTQRKLQHQAGLPTSGRGSAIHWRHSDVLDWDAPPTGGGGRKGSRGVGLKGGRQHKESRQQALVFQRLRDGVRQIQEKQNSAGPVSKIVRHCRLFVLTEIRCKLVGLRLPTARHRYTFSFLDRQDHFAELYQWLLWPSLFLVHDMDTVESR